MNDLSSVVQTFVDRHVSEALRAASSVEARVSPVYAERSSPLTVAIPIFNNPAALRRCLDSVIPTLQSSDLLWLLDDASDDPEIAEVIGGAGSMHPCLRITSHRENLGLVATANTALEGSDNDVVLLNSDTIVVEGWLEQLQTTASTNRRCGIVCPVSDNATILSVISRFPVAPASRELKPAVRIPTAVGFCMLIRRSLFNRIGGFSPEFSPGYGEENDLSMRAMKVGFDILAATGAVVLHSGGGSFPAHVSGQLRQAHERRLNTKWPEYRSLVSSWWRDNPLRSLAEAQAHSSSQKPRVLHVLHRQYHIGGTEQVARQLVSTLRDDFEQTLIYPGETNGPWCDVEVRHSDPIRELMLNSRPIRPSLRIASQAADLSCSYTEAVFTRILQGMRPIAVHFHHLMHWDSLILPLIAKKLGMRVVIGLHDFYSICPVHNQLEYGTNSPCGIPRCGSSERCTPCLTGYASGNEAIVSRLSDYASLRLSLVERVLNEADAVVVPSHFLRSRLVRAFPKVSPLIVPHGVNAAESTHESTGSPRVLGFFGGDQTMKGARLIIEIAEKLADLPIVIEIHGRIKGFSPNALPANIRLRGFYNPQDAGQRMSETDMVLIPSFYEESFSVTLSEAWAAGVPSMVSNRGALPERVIDGTNGWVVAEQTADAWAARIREACGDTSQWNRIKRNVQRLNPVSLADAAKQYQGMYLGDGDRLAPARASCKIQPPGDREFDRLLRAFRSRIPGSHNVQRPVANPRVTGIIRDRWATAQFRVCLPLEHLAQTGHIRLSGFHCVRDHGFDVSESLRLWQTNHVVVQPFLSDDGLRMMEQLSRTVGLSITLVIDDLWTALPPYNSVRSMMPPDIADRLAYAASLSDQVVLTTNNLKLRLGLHHPAIHVIDNALPETWPMPQERPQRAKPRIGWAGAPQHEGDLAILEPVVEATADQFEWVFFGMSTPGLRRLRVKEIAMAPFEEYPDQLAALQLDVAVVPVVDNVFNRCKSALKVLEFGALGIPVVASALPPYTSTPARLTDNDTQSWIDALNELTVDQETAHAEGERLRRWVLDHHRVHNRIDQWARLFASSQRDAA